MSRFNSMHTLGDLTAAADLRTNQYKGVRITAANAVNTVTASTQLAVGIQLNKPNTNEEVEICDYGLCKAVAGAAVSAGAELMFDSSGRVITAATATNRVVGQAVEAAANAGDIIAVLIGNPTRVL